MAKVPPAGVVAVTEKARSGLRSLERQLVPSNIALLDFVRDFWSFHVTFTLAELRAVDALQGGPRRAEEVARELGVDGDHLYRLLRAGTMLGLVKEENGRVFALDSLGRALCESPTASLRDFVVFMGRYGTRFWRRLPDCVREGKTAIELETGKKTFDYAVSDPEFHECFNRAMTAVSNVACEAIAAAYDFSRFTRIVDIGGGHGRLLGELLRGSRGPRGVLFDMPEVVAGARPVLESLGVVERVECVGGSFFEAVPEGGDCYTAKAIIHDWNDPEARTILKAIRQAIRSDGTLLLLECVVTPPGRGHFAKLLDIEMIVHGGGRERTTEEYRALFASAGFSLTRIVPTAGPLSVVEARPL
ncbi:MAG TPA: methyltransferase [Polyangiaceae bacterium]|nr:methyltransferase [Polyangiaceae bacterium]